MGELSKYSLDAVSNPAPALLSLEEENNALFVSIKVAINSKSITLRAFLDSGACHNFIDRQFCLQNHIPLKSLSTSPSFRLINGSTLSSDSVSHTTVPLPCLFGDTLYPLTFLVGDFPTCQLILGYPWFRTFNPRINWNDLVLTLPWNSLALSTMPCPEPLDLAALPAEYHDLKLAFSEVEANILPDQRPFDCTIDLKDPSAPLPFKPIYNLSIKEQEALKSYIHEMLAKGFIRPSKSPCASPIFFVPKNDGSLRPCVDYRAINALTVKDRTPLPLISDLLDKIAGAKVFTRIDLRGAYNLVRVKKGHEWKTAFRCKYGLFEYLVMPFGLQNAPAVFQRMMNLIFSDTLDVFVVIYLDDLLIFSRNAEEHVQHVRAVLHRLIQHKLFAKMEKCLFNVKKVEFLGYILSAEGISPVPEKVAAIKDWPIPKNVKEVQSFLGLANFYRRFVPGFAEKARPLTNLTRKDCQFTWSNGTQKAFDDIKHALINAPVLLVADPSQPFILETDASEFACGAVLAQKKSNDQFPHPIAFISRKFQPAEINYSVHDKELLAIVTAFETWRHYLVGNRHPIDVYCDHKNLTFFRDKSIVKPRHARWHLLLSEFDFRLNYIRGKNNQIADALSRRPDFESSKQVSVPGSVVPSQAWPTIGAIIYSDTLGLEIDLEKDWPLVIAHFLVEDSWPTNLPTQVLNKCRKEATNFRILGVERRLVRTTEQGSVNYLPSTERKAAIKRYHDFLGHLSAASILPLLQRRFWFPKMEEEVKNFCQECITCQQNRPDSQSARRAPLRPIPPVGLPFERWGMDFIGPLPMSKAGNRYIITAIDYATRWIVAKAVPEKSSRVVMSFIYNDIIMQYGPPYELITDRDKSFLEDALPHYEELLRIKHLSTTSYHPRTNGMVERMHQMLNHAIRTTTQDFMDRWDEFLNQAVFSIRARTHSVTGHSPFYLLFGVHPRIPIDKTPPRSTMMPLDEIENMELRAEHHARDFEELGLHRRAALERTKTQAEAMRRRDMTNHLESDKTHRFDIGDWVKIKMKQRTKWERQWVGPLMVVQLGHPGTYWLMNFRGEWLPNLVNEERLAFWKGADPGTMNPGDDDEVMDYIINEPPDYVTPAGPSYHVDPEELNVVDSVSGEEDDLLTDVPD